MACSGYIQVHVSRCPGRPTPNSIRKDSEKGLFQGLSCLAIAQKRPSSSPLTEVPLTPLGPDTFNVIPSRLPPCLHSLFSIAAVKYPRQVTLWSKDTHLAHSVGSWMLNMGQSCLTFGKDLRLEGITLLGVCADSKYMTIQKSRDVGSRFAIFITIHSWRN